MAEPGDSLGTTCPAPLAQEGRPVDSLGKHDRDFAVWAVHTFDEGCE